MKRKITKQTIGHANKILKLAEEQNKIHISRYRYSGNRVPRTNQQSHYNNY